MDGNASREALERAFAARQAAFPLWSDIGIEWVSHGPGKTVLSMELGPDHHNPVGVVHGGVVMGLLDTAMGFASTSVLDEAGTMTSTISLSFTFLRAVRNGRVRAEGRVIRKGRNVIHLEGTLWTTEGEVAASAIGAWAILRPKSS